MTLTKTIQKLEKLGFKVESDGYRHWVVYNSDVIEFLSNGRPEDDRNVVCIRVRAVKDNDDSQSDYCAGVWCDNITQALKLAGVVK
jgi:hypothetical protein